MAQSSAPSMCRLARVRREQRRHPPPPSILHLPPSPVRVLFHLAVPSFETINGPTRSLTTTTPLPKCAPTITHWGAASSSSIDPSSASSSPPTSLSLLPRYGAPSLPASGCGCLSVWGVGLHLTARTVGCTTSAGRRVCAAPALHSPPLHLVVDAVPNRLPSPLRAAHLRQPPGAAAAQVLRLLSQAVALQLAGPVPWRCGQGASGAAVLGPVGFTTSSAAGTLGGQGTGR